MPEDLPRPEKSIKQIEKEQLVDSISCIVDITQRILDCLTMWLKEKKA